MSLTCQFRTSRAGQGDDKNRWPRSQRRTLWTGTAHPKKASRSATVGVGYRPEDNAMATPAQGCAERRFAAIPADRMRRRQFIALLGAAVAWPLPTHAQQAKGPVRIGFLFFGSPSNSYDQSLVEAFRQGLRQVGLVENQDVVLDVVWISGDPDQAVTEVIHRGAELLVPCGSSASVATKRHALTIPIVFISVGNPVAMGLVDSLARPGSNATGFSDILGDLGIKLVELAKELNESQTAIDYLWHTGWPDGQNRYLATERAAQMTGVQLRSHGITESDDVTEVIAAMKEGGAKTIIIQPSPVTYNQRGRIIESAARYGLGTIFAWPIAAREGALVGYGPDYLHMYRRAPLYVERILKGAQPADLPVELPSKVELVVNLKTAKTLGLKTPLALLVRADELIE
jgi:putative tryptophan/tyrosine transport system substrate-binding protein